MPAQICMKLLLLVFVSLLLTSCAPRSEPVLDEATVVAKNASLRLKNSSTSRTLRVLDTGEKVDVLEHQDNWYRVRYGRSEEHTSELQSRGHLVCRLLLEK